jgi:hypothetical protein
LESQKGRDYLKDRWEDNIKMDLGEIRWEDVDWTYVAQEGDWWQTLVNLQVS